MSCNEGRNGFWEVISMATFCAALVGCVQTNSILSDSASPSPVSSNPIAPSPPPQTLDPEEANFVTLINQYRIQNGLAALELSLDLTESSQWLSTDMAVKNYFSHTDSLGRDTYTRMAAFGYTNYEYAGENIAAGNATAQDTFTQWKNSPPHNANMLDANYLFLGVGRAYDASSTYGWYWTTDFGDEVD